MSGAITVNEVDTIINEYVCEVRESGSSLVVRRASLVEMVGAAFRLGRSREATGDTSSDRPPLGLRPEAIANKEFNGQRVEEIRQAMGRYIAAGKEFPSEWIQELHLRTAPERAFVLSSNGDYMHGKLFNGAFQAIEKATP
ncbi:MAG: hypothetical protein I8H71_01205 [Xanthomonadaceae bacterium]|nr:hypothetical protein [Xanthomonadaceae bacterium]